MSQGAVEKRAYLENICRQVRGASSRRFVHNDKFSNSMAELLGYDLSPCALTGEQENVDAVFQS